MGDERTDALIKPCLIGIALAEVGILGETCVSGLPALTVAIPAVGGAARTGANRIGQRKCSGKATLSRSKQFMGTDTFAAVADRQTQAAAGVAGGAYFAVQDVGYAVSGAGW